MEFPEQDRPYAHFLNILRRSTDRLNEDPTREEFFSIEKLEIYASYLAGELYVTTTPKRGRFVLPDLKANGRELLSAYLQLAEVIRGKQAVSPAAEWFVDNFHIVEEQIREIKQDLPKSYYDELPKLATGELEGYPRVYAMALAIIAHTDSRLDGESVRRFIRAFQQRSPMTIGELWAIPITLRIALVEHLKPLALRIVSARQKRSEADELADLLLGMAVHPDTQPQTLLETLKEKVGKPEDFDRAFTVQLIQRLRDQDLDVLPAFDWLERQLGEYHKTNTQDVTQLEHNRQATAQVTVGNIISSMRLLSALDWKEFVESVSLVDPILTQDPAAAYSKMDFNTRDRYRHAIERISKRSNLNEIEVAKAVLASAQRGAEDPRRSHVGYYLIGDGRFNFQASVKYRPRLRERIVSWGMRYPTTLYLGSLAALTLLLLIPVLKYFSDTGGHGFAAFCFCLLALIPASEFALSILNHNVAFFLKPKPLPKLDVEKGIPADAVTVVVIPTLLTSESVIHELLENLQVHYLANRDPNIYFALLGDYADAEVENHPKDAGLLELAMKGIDTLNAKYGELEPRFFIFHRRRLFNAAENKWMGYERKRGKLHEFNRLLRGATDTSFLPQELEPSFLARVQYVITLDSDTQLPRGSAHKLIGTILHPLNRPVYDKAKGRVTLGYGILQPRVSVSLVSANRSRFARLFSGNTGLDPYTTACSDVYQDLFEEGSYTGKGLYVVDAFESALANRVPENSLLSHDLFEGCFARSALVSDVELFDDYPKDYEIYSKRQHRWVRGDWQIASWIFKSSPLTVISRWKIFDNLRRSLVPITVFFWLLLSWSFLPGSALIWTSMIIILFVFPVYSTVTNNLFHHRQGVSWRGQIRHGWVEIALQTQQIVLMLVFLAEQAWNQSDAIFRTLYRKLISKKYLLEWTSFAQVQDERKRISGWIDWVGAGPLLGVMSTALVSTLRPNALFVASPFLLLWILNPAIKNVLRQRVARRLRALDTFEVTAFRNYARRTWHFFETFVTKEENYLAPDNFQEEPKPVVARRTSPTNMGLQLLSLSSAYDFGYVGVMEFLESAERTFQTMAKLKRLHGHFFNWYSTETLEALRPQYISTVDSGNLAGHLLAFKQAISELAVALPTNPRAKAGLIDTLSILKGEISLLEDTVHSLGVVSLDQLRSLIDKLLVSVKAESVTTVADFERFIAWVKTSLNECDDILSTLMGDHNPSTLQETRIWLKAALHQTDEFHRDLIEADPEIIGQMKMRLMDQCDEFALGMNFKFLFDEQRKIFVIGYNVMDNRRDVSFYDLLASESRLTSFLGIAKGEIPEEHWFRLGRQMTKVKSGRALISWTATMFEYLMPLLVMRRYEDTLLDQTYESVVARQIEYGKQQGVPWGISEAGYNARDLQLIYQYGPFGVPGLGLKRGLSDDLVVSPYSTMLAAVIDPHSALSNLKTLEGIGALARYGFYESIDYTPERLQKTQKSFILRSFMAHHQGMSLVSLNNLLNGFVMQRRFHSEPIVQATQLLLQERIPHNVTISRPRAEEVHYQGTRLPTDWNPRIYTDVDLPTPRTQILSNGIYSVMVTTAGSGYSRSGNYAVNRWREDVTRDNWGHFFYIRNRSNHRVWSVGHQPIGFTPKKYEVTFAEDKVEFKRQDGNTSTHMEIIVSPEDNAEIRRISLTNHSAEAREFEVTSFMELCLSLQADDVAHPAFSNLFIQTEFLPTESALLATRRRRSELETQIWGFHVLVTEGECVGAVQYETDRARFLGRGRNASDAFANKEDRPLSNTVGSVLDPIFSMRQCVRIAPGETARVSFATGCANSRSEAVRLADKYHDIHTFTRETELAWTKARVQLRHLNIGSDQAHTFQRLAGRVIFSDPSLRPRSHNLELNRKTQAGLWAYGISGDIPIILVRIADEKDMKMVRELLHAHEYLRLKGLVIDLVLLNERDPSYLQKLQEELQRQIRMSGAQALVDKPGGVFIRRADIIPKEDVELLKSVARVDINSDKGTFEEQLKRRPFEVELPADFTPVKPNRNGIEKIAEDPVLEFFNGLGGFADRGKEYVIVLKEGQWTPAPWINVIANAHDFGFLISESGSGYTWSLNSRENRLTPWSNDAVSDPVSEAIYIRDEETGEYWTPTPLPIREKETYVIRHGQGYSHFEHQSHGIKTNLSVFVPLNDTVKISYLRLKNTTTETRRLSVTSYVEWVLGVNRESSSRHVNAFQDKETGTLIARNFYNNEFAHRTAFSHMADIDSFSCDRKTFLGRNGSPAKPAALSRESLASRSGAGLDPAACLQKKFTLGAGEEKEIVVLLGQVNDLKEVNGLTRKYDSIENVRRAFGEVEAYWEKVLGTIEINTPDLAMNILVNRWLLYQTLSCRVWARSAFYQSGGAFGFRDQLQDVMALVYAEPQLARKQILIAAARQFKEGDVQHWWHPPTGRGVRTHFSDDLIWLPFVTSFYINATGDRSILEEKIAFIEAPLLDPNADSEYLQPTPSKDSASLLEHCCLTLDRSLKTGEHGLPLMGTGDWNDGMSRVGHGGKGESVWVAWFLYAALKEFIPLLGNDQTGRASEYSRHMILLQENADKNGWDGDWYRRAYFDNGTPLGSSSNDECRIDSIAQSWAVLSGAGNPQKAVRAMAAVDEYLINRGEGLVKLFTPPFDKGNTDPGYIKGYVPGVRENGGQYTHAAVWTLMAFAALGDGERAGELYSLLNPINHSSTRAGLHKYKVEPYVLAADIYGMYPHLGRGGWTWYTGSSSWMYRAAIQSILGFELRGDRLNLRPCIPKSWPSFDMVYRYKATTYLIFVDNRLAKDATHETVLELDKVRLASHEVPLVDDGKSHRIDILL